IRKWVRIYLKYGRKGLEGKKKNKKYPVQFKVSVIEYKLRIGESFNNIALHFDITEPSLIYSLYKLCHSKWIDGLSIPKWRPSKCTDLKKIADKKLTKKQQLEKEIELLRAENAYLKKLRASRINIPNRLRKDRKSTRLNSSHVSISYAVFCLKKKNREKRILSSQ